MTARAARRLADAVRAAIGAGTVEDVLVTHLADPVAVHHDPPLPGDGPMARDAFASLLRGDPMRALVPDASRSYGEVSVAGDVVAFTSTLEGTTVDGERVRIANTTMLTVSNDGITTLVQRYEPDALEALTRLAPRRAEKERAPDRMRQRRPAPDRAPKSPTS